MKTKLIFSFIFLFSSSLFSQICPKTFRACVATTFETTNLGDGAIAIEDVSGGAAPYSYVWNTGDTTAAIDSISAGNYNVVISDSNNCTYKLCVLVDKDSLPCNYTFANLINGDTIDIEQNLLLLKKPNQTGAVIEFYDKNSNFLSSYYTDVTNNNNSNIFDVFITSNYYNQYAKVVARGVFGSDTSEYCGDTAYFVVQDFECNIEFTGEDYEYTDTIALNSGFLTDDYYHCTSLIYELFDVNGNFISSYVGTNNNGETFTTNMSQSIYYNERYQVTFKIVYGTTDTIASCDTAKFTAANFDCNFTWFANSCRDTVRSNNVFSMTKGYHGYKAMIELYDTNTNLLGTYDMDYPGSLFGIYNPSIFIDGNSYKMIPIKIFRYADTVNYNLIDTVSSCGDTCRFTVDNSSSRIKNGGGISSPLNSQLSTSTIYPNPTDGLLNLDYSQKGYQNVTIKIYGVNGQLVKQVSKSSDNSIYQLNTSELGNGIYMMKVEAPDNSTETISFSVIH